MVNFELILRPSQVILLHQQDSRTDTNESTSFATISDPAIRKTYNFSFQSTKSIKFSTSNSNKIRLRYEAHALLPFKLRERSLFSKYSKPIK